MQPYHLSDGSIAFYLPGDGPAITEPAFDGYHRRAGTWIASDSHCLAELIQNASKRTQLIGGDRNLPP